MPRTVAAAALVAVVSVAALTACTRNQPAGGQSGSAIAVSATESTCQVSTDATTSGTAVFAITNNGQRATEFEILARDGLTVIGELENIGPGLTRTLSVQAQPGTYSTMCKPGMTGEGVGEAAFTVTGKTVQVSGDQQALATEAATRYRSYVRDQADRLLTATRAFAQAYTSGDDVKAKRLYPLARANYERIEPIAESFGDLDPRLDAREHDVAAGSAWTGWHRIEKDLWAPGGSGLDASGRKAAADVLVSGTEELKSRVDATGFRPAADTIGNGAVGLLDEVAKSKVTGEEERYSHTDLYDFQANVEGAEVAYRGIRDIAAGKDRQLVADLDARFAALDASLAKHGSFDAGFKPYTALSGGEVKTLSDQVNALAEPLSRLTATVLR